MIRNKVLAVILVCLISLFAVERVKASQFSGSYLFQVCNMDEKGQEILKGGHAVCQSYISGVIDYHNVLRALKVAPSVNICIPETVGTYDLQKIVLSYLRANGQHDEFNASPAVTMALYEVFPCKR